MVKLIVEGKQYVDQIAVERANYERLINRIKTSHMTIRGAVGRWSVKEAIAHIHLCELYLAERIIHIFSNHDLDRYLSDGQFVRLFFGYDHPEFGTPFESDYISVNIKIQKYSSIPLEDVVGLENMAYLSLISHLQMNEEQLMTRRRFYKQILVKILDLYDYHTTTIESWLAVLQ